MRRSLLRRLFFGETVTEKRERFAKDLDGQRPTPEQLRQLGLMARDALCEIRSRNREPEVVFALADAFHNLPLVMHDPRFSWSWLLVFLTTLERDFPDIGRRYVEVFDRIVGFKAEPAAAPDRPAPGAS
ncbi:MAG: hypothetical protein C0467_22475 [Planctomycetaceae bacterium]|nr:hypothetical protein [Planctomycetaceae bacterium]